MFGCQCFEKRGLHDPVQSPKPGDVLGEQVILNESSILRLILAHDGVILVEKQFRATYRFSVAHIQGELLFHDIIGKS